MFFGIFDVGILIPLNSFILKTICLNIGDMNLLFCNLKKVPLLYVD